MAESKGTMLAKSMQKHAGRAKEKILQNLGKVDRTADEIFDDHLNNFTRQQASANRLQKEFNNYIRCIRAAQTASKSLMDAISEIYEPQWTGYDALQAQTAASDSLWQDFAHKLGDQVLIPLNTYTGQFPEMKKKVEKRNRKLIDYDSQRHSFQSLQASANKRKDDVKLTKGREQLEEARRTYEILNTELHDELPALYDSRILFLVTNLQTLFATEQVFHNETAKIYAELEAIVDKLATDSQRGSNTLRKQAMNAIKSSSPVQSPVKQMNNANNINTSNNYQNQITTNGSSNINSPTSSPSTSSPPPPPPQQQQQQEATLDSVSPETPETTTEVPKSPTTTKAETTAPPVTATSPEKATATTEPSYQNAAAAAIIVATALPATTTTILTEAKPTTNSPDAISASINETEKPTTVSPPNASPIKSAATKANVASAKDEMLNNVGPNAAAAAAAAAPASSDGVAKPAASTTKVAKATPSIPTIKGQLNGNGNETENGNDNASIEDNNKSLGNETLNGIRKKLVHKNPFEEEEEVIYEVPKDATTTDLPPGVLYRVKATYGYVKEDVDELSFEVGDTIRVIEYDDPDDQEEGWLMGQKEGTDEKGLFPANFTRPI